MENKKHLEVIKRMNEFDDRFQSWQNANGKEEDVVNSFNDILKEAIKLSNSKADYDPSNIYDPINITLILDKASNTYMKFNYFCNRTGLNINFSDILNEFIKDFSEKIIDAWSKLDNGK